MVQVITKLRFRIQISIRHSQALKASVSPEIVLVVRATRASIVRAHLTNVVQARLL